MAKSKGQAPPSEYQELARKPPLMTVLSDGPLPPDEAGADQLNVAVKLAPLFDILRHPETQTPLAIAIYGKWGSGKTSAMRWLDAMCRDWNAHGEHTESAQRRKKKVLGKKIRTVWFYPWKYHDRDDVWRGLVSEVILKSIDVGEPTWGRVTKAVKSFGIFLGRSFLHALGSISAKAKLPGGTGEVEVDFAAVRDIWEEYQRAAHPEKGYLNEFETALRSWIEETISAESERMVIFIDDLDRCLPPVMLNVLEALKLYLDIKDLVFVLGLDREVIDEVVKKHYRDNGVAEEKAERYLDKMFQVEVTMQPTDVQVEAFLDTEIAAIGKLTNEYWQKELSPEEQGVFRNVVLELAQQNPREVKRLLNSMLIHGAGAMQVKE